MNFNRFFYLTLFSYSFFISSAFAMNENQYAELQKAVLEYEAQQSQEDAARKAIHGPRLTRKELKEGKDILPEFRERLGYERPEETSVEKFNRLFSDEEREIITELLVAKFSHEDAFPEKFRQTFSCNKQEELYKALFKE